MKLYNSTGVARGYGWQHLAVCINLVTFYLVGMTIAAILGTVDWPNLWSLSPDDRAVVAYKVHEMEENRVALIFVTEAC
ncbi:Hypothetical predicted protein [Olea europaea subsp. europaea]|uniref:Uncharacterized protein n=1 Tax=Olea europaea subsp. europaea TaxID=158383 RepID=A0A8S0QI30_OLEEU|nr:Hypothetical predicted protein [Olea europaea subsp. europaea]